MRKKTNPPKTRPRSALRTANGSLKLLKESEEKYRALLETSTDIILTHDLQGRITYCNKYGLKITGYDESDLLGRSVASLLPPEELAAMEERGRARRAGDTLTYEYETQFINKAGRTVPIEVHTVPFVTEGHPPQFMLCARDITERKRADDLLKRYANQLKVINQLDRTISATFDIGEVYDSLVAGMHDLFPFDCTALVTLGEDGTEWWITKQWTSGEPAFSLKTVMPVKGSIIEWLVQNKCTLVENRMEERGTWPESELLKKEGISSHVLVPLIVKGTVIGVMTLASKIPEAYTPRDVEIMESLADQVGISMHNAMLHAKVQDHAATLERRVVERTSQLQSANKELDAFASSVSHDLRAPLRHISGYIGLLKDEAGSTMQEECGRYLHKISEAANHMNHLIDDLLSFSRMAREEMRTSLLDPAALVREVIADLAHETGERTIHWTLNDMPMVAADPAMLKLVFVNLLSNAHKFTRTREPAEIVIGASTSDDGNIVFSVRDNGVGFAQENAHKLFGVFQRLHTKEEFEGTGIGLANVQRIIQRHGGKTWAEGEPDKGASFYFSLPRPAAADPRHD